MAMAAIEEARMVLPGIQALFGFQLIAAFNETRRLTYAQSIRFVDLFLLQINQRLLVKNVRIQFSKLGKLDDLFGDDLGQGIVAVGQPEPLQNSLISRRHRSNLLGLEYPCINRPVERHNYPPPAWRADYISWASPPAIELFVTVLRRLREPQKIPSGVSDMCFLRSANAQTGCRG